MKNITFYNRTCSGCKPVREFLERQKIAFDSVDVRANPIAPEEALQILRSARKAFVKSGSGVKEIEISRKNPTDDELLKLFLGRSGSMRAPVLRIADQLLAGFDAATLKMMLKK